jgi:hypothetical protein
MAGYMWWCVSDWGYCVGEGVGTRVLTVPCRPSRATGLRLLLRVYVYTFWVFVLLLLLWGCGVMYLFTCLGCSVQIGRAHV